MDLQSDRSVELREAWKKKLICALTFAGFSLRHSSYTSSLSVPPSYQLLPEYSINLRVWNARPYTAVHVSIRIMRGCVTASRASTWSDSVSKLQPQSRVKQSGPRALHAPGTGQAAIVRLVDLAIGKSLLPHIPPLVACLSRSLLAFSGEGANSTWKVKHHVLVTRRVERAVRNVNGGM